METYKTLRDEFAMAAMRGYLASPHTIVTDEPTLAKFCYIMADAMLKEREKTDHA